MADKKITQLTSLTSPVTEDLLLIIDDPNGTPISKKITVGNLAGNLPNTSITGTLNVSSNTTIAGSNTVFSSNVNFSSSRGTQFTARWIKIAPSTGSISNNATTELGGGQQGSILIDSNYLYVAVSNTVIKRVLLSNFNS
jgi:hypothetical protein